MSEQDLGWWVIAGDVLLDGLRRAAEGEDPDLVYAELYANAECERPAENPALAVSDQAIDEAAEAILVAHQAHRNASCLCGWAELGRSHPGHQVAMLREAGLLNDADLGRPNCQESRRPT
jgi:hypothetical protein